MNYWNATFPAFALCKKHNETQSSKASGNHFEKPTTFKSLLYQFLEMWTLSIVRDELWQTRLDNRLIVWIDCNASVLRFKEPRSVWLIPVNAITQHRPSATSPQSLSHSVTRQPLWIVRRGASYLQSSEDFRENPSRNAWKEALEWSRNPTGIICQGYPVSERPGEPFLCPGMCACARLWGVDVWSRPGDVTAVSCWSFERKQQIGEGGVRRVS